MGSPGLGRWESSWDPWAEKLALWIKEGPSLSILHCHNTVVALDSWYLLTVLLYLGSPAHNGPQTSLFQVPPVPLGMRQVPSITLILFYFILISWELKGSGWSHL